MQKNNPAALRYHFRISQHTMPPRKQRRVDYAEGNAEGGGAAYSPGVSSTDSSSSGDDDLQPAKRKAPAAHTEAKGKKTKLAASKVAGGGARADPTAALLTRQQPKRSTDGKLLLTVGITGARAGDIVEGSAVDTVGVVLRVVRGICLAPDKLKETLDQAEVVSAVARKFAMSTARAEQWVADIPSSNVTSRGKRRPNHQPLGCGCHCGGVAVSGSCTSSAESVRRRVPSTHALARCVCFC